MPNDLWSYRGVIFRGIIALPLILLCMMSERMNDRFNERLSRFIDWDYK